MIMYFCVHAYIYVCACIMLEGMLESTHVYRHACRHTYINMYVCMYGWMDKGSTA